MERITDLTPEIETRGHRFRYHLAAGFLKPGDRVLDAACGSAYGANILTARDGVRYQGVDKEAAGPFSHVNLTGDPHFLSADLETWQPDFPFDVFVGFETAEHLDDYNNYLDIARSAERWAILSVPIVPTVGVNPYHKHNFQRGELIDHFIDSRWLLFQAVDQPTELSEIYVFRRR